MKTTRKILSLVLVLMMIFPLSVTASAEAGSGEPQVSREMSGEIVILHTNDVHGAIERYAAVAALKAEYEARGAYVLLMDAGDFIQGDPAVNVSKGAAAVELMGLAGYDVVTPGNHEFDYGYDNLKTVLKDAPFAVVAANVRYNGKFAFSDNAVFTAPDGTKIGVFGLVAPDTQTKAHPSKIQGVSFASGDEMFSLARAQVGALKAAGCDYIIALGHLGISGESEGNRSIDLLNNVGGINVFIDGHSHSTIEEVAAATNETRTINGAVLTSTGTKLENIGVITISGGKISTSSVAVSGLGVTPDAAVAARAREISDEIDADYGKVFASAEIALNGSRDPGNRTEETNFGDLVTDAMLWKAAAQKELVDAALTNGGGIRETIKAGNITRREFSAALPFTNTLSIVKLTGAELLEALEASTFCSPEALGGFPQVSGIKFVLDTTVPYDKGELYPDTTYYAPASIGRVTIESVGGKPFSLTETYTIATNDFTASGGDTYYAFKAASLNYELGYAIDEVVTEYITTVLHGKITNARYGSTDGEITIIRNPFTDVSMDDWFYANIMSAYKSDIMNGVSASAFEPEGKLSRAMLVTMLYRMAGSPAVSGSVSDAFTDCEDDAWYSSAVLWAYQNKLTDGVGDGIFAPSAVLTRQQMAKILYSFAVYSGVAEITVIDLSVFTDSGDIASWAAEGVAFCNAAGIMGSASEKESVFLPNGAATRAMGAAVLDRIAAAA